MKLDKIVCISFNKDNRKFINRQSKKKKFNLDFSKYAKNNTTEEYAGSHFNIIREAKKSKNQNVCILEDHIKLLGGIGQFPQPPFDWASWSVLNPHNLIL